MMKQTIKRVRTPLTAEAIKDLVAGEKVEITGVLYTARDQAHKRIADAIKNNEPLPFDLNGRIIYYAGPSPAPEGKPTGSIGPTTSGRMDIFTPLLLENGLKGMIGKGPRSTDAKNAIKKCGAVYFAATGGVAALLSTFVKKSEIIAYEDLGPEAVYRLEVERFPAIVAIDTHGNDVYDKRRL
jgi:fumarate hydratase subunit beta